MARLSDYATSVRAKNAGPFWVTIDIFFADVQSFNAVVQNLPTRDIASLLKLDPDLVKRFELADISVLKFSFPRPTTQGNRFDRDMHGAQYAWLLDHIELP